jgi:hypothetical protein
MDYGEAVSSGVARRADLDWLAFQQKFALN